MALILRHRCLQVGVHIGGWFHFHFSFNSHSDSNITKRPYSVYALSIFIISWQSEVSLPVYSKAHNATSKLVSTSQSSYCQSWWKLLDLLFLDDAFRGRTSELLHQETSSSFKNSGDAVGMSPLCLSHVIICVSAAYLSTIRKQEEGRTPWFYSSLQERWSY